MSQHFDVCNGDADGLCAAVQWRLHEVATAVLLTGLKREISLLERVHAGAGDEVNVFDLSMSRNREALQHLLDAGVRVRYFDHHAAGDIPSHPLLETHVDCASDVCTSLLVDRHLGGAFRAWALVGAYGDNLAMVAARPALRSGVDDGACAFLRRLGEAINYNAYGDVERDVHILPRQLFAIMMRYPNPLDMLAHETVVDEIDAVRRADLRQALEVPTAWQDDRASVHVLPDAPWSRRVLGCLANRLANAEPQRAHAVLKQTSSGYAVSVRAPLAHPSGAHELCDRFGGGGRARAAGIEALAPQELTRFVCAFASAKWGGAAAAGS